MDKTVLVTVICLTCIAFNSWGDDDALQVSYQHEEDSRVSAGNGSLVAVSQDRLALPVAMSKTPDGYWFVGAQITQTLITYHGANYGESRLYRLALPMDYIHNPGSDSRWQFIGRIEPAHYADERLLDHRSSQVEYATRLSYRYRPDLNIIAGFKLDRRLGMARRYYVAGVEWQQSSRLWHHWVFPDWKSEYQMNRRTVAFAHARPTGGEWRAGKYADHQRIHYVNWAMSVGARYQTRSPYALRMEFGQNRWRKIVQPTSSLTPKSSWFWLFSVEALL